ncbi:MAG: TIR domain-containing protein [Desulfobacteraceae bacterium]|nr:TIR domain-containing protein [Desulfobacteraceae bacterium]
MKQIFISYAQFDEDFATKLYDILEQAGLNPWMNTDIVPGERITHTVRQAIHNSTYFLALLSKKSLSESGRIHRELSIAIDKGQEDSDHKIFIIPVRLDDCKADKEFLIDIQPVDLFQSPETELEKLLRLLITEEKNEYPLSPFLQMNVESVRKLVKKPERPRSRYLVLWGMIILGLLCFFTLFHLRHKSVKDNLKSANRFLNNGMYSEALDQYEQALKNCLGCAKVLADKKKAEFFKETAETDYNPGTMIERLKNIPGVPENDPHIRLLTGNMYVQMRKDEKAEDIYLEIIQEEPELAEAWFSLGILYHKQGNRKHARKMYEKAVSISEHNFRYLDNLAWIDIETGQYHDAVQSYKKMLDGDKNFLLAYAEIAKALWMDKKPGTALDNLRILMKKIENPRITDHPVNKAPWFFPLKDESVIIDNLSTKKYYAAYSLAASCYMLGYTSEAETHLKKAEKLQIEYADAINIRTLINHDISEIREKYAEHDEIIKRAEIFRAKKAVE